jgi:hypothetical protein
MMEYWNDDLKNKISLFNIHQYKLYNTQFFIFIESNIPVFHHSSILILSGANQLGVGELK